MSVLLLGGTGFLGQAIVKILLSHQKKVMVLTRNPKKIQPFDNLSFLVADLMDLPQMDLTPYEQIINCAGEIRNERLMRKINIDAPLNLLKQFSKSSHRHWIQISSVGVYGKPRFGIISEDSSHSPCNEYESTKSEGEQQVKHFCQTHEVNYTIIRPSNVFGVGMTNQSLAQLIQLIKKNLFFYIGNSSDVIMNYIPVEDVAQVVLCCLNNKDAHNQDFIISDYLNLLELATLISKIFGRHRDFPVIPEKPLRSITKLLQKIPFFPLSESRIDALTSQVIYSADKVKKQLNFALSVGIKAGLKNYCREF